MVMMIILGHIAQNNAVHVFVCVCFRSFYVALSYRMKLVPVPSTKPAWMRMIFNPPTLVTTALN